MTAGQFFQNTNWFMTGIVLAWVAVTIGYIIVRATQSLANLSTGILIWGIWVLIIEVSLPSQSSLICPLPFATCQSVCQSVCLSVCLLFCCCLPACLVTWLCTVCPPVSLYALLLSARFLSVSLSACTYQPAFQHTSASEAEISFLISLAQPCVLCVCSERSASICQYLASTECPIHMQALPVCMSWIHGMLTADWDWTGRTSQPAVATASVAGKHSSHHPVLSDLMHSLI